MGKPTLGCLCHCIATTLSDRQPAASQICVWRDRIGDGCVLDLP
ncbi:hypothetical protein [Comamonas sp. Y33R10-2]|nr:hypothetical protein [Comamonas sp. Y33R10-2]